MVPLIIKKPLNIFFFLSLFLCFTSCFPKSTDSEAPEIYEIWIAEKVVVSDTYGTNVYDNERDWQNQMTPVFGGLFTPYAYCFYKDGRYHEFANASDLNEYLEAPEAFTPGYHDKPDGTFYLISGLERWKMDNQYFYSTWNCGKSDTPEDYIAFYKIVSQNKTQIVLRLLNTSPYAFPPNEEESNYKYLATFKRTNYVDIQR